MRELCVTSITPFGRNNRTNDSAMRQLWDRNFAEGADGFFIGGGSGKCFLLSREERVHTFELTGEYTDRTGMFVHVGAINMEEAIFYARKTKEVGMQNIAATPPFYFGSSDKEMAGYYYDIAEVVGMPVLYYNIPSSTHRELNPSQPDLATLLKSGAVGAIKHTSLNPCRMGRVHDANPDIRCYDGFENCMIAFLAFECGGFIDSNSSFILPQHEKVMELYLPHHGDEVRILQSESNYILGAVLRSSLCVSPKYIASYQGIQTGGVRKSVCPLAENRKAEIGRVIGMCIEIE